MKQLGIFKKTSKFIRPLQNDGMHNGMWMGLREQGVIHHLEKHVKALTGKTTNSNSQIAPECIAVGMCDTLC